MHLPRLLLISAIALSAEAALAEAPPQDQLAEMSIEQLLNVTVTSVARRSEKLADSPAAVHVISQEELRRSGVTSIPEALRLVPGLNVARANTHSWAISSRGFNDNFANKLLVLIDGRSVYTPLFSGVYWDVQDMMLEDIDRIEVIRGPGAALWGANAVNGVINIISKRAAETQGTLATAGGGTEERGFASVRYGGKLGNDLYYRVYGKYFNRDDSAAFGGGEADDAWEAGRTGFRVDYEPAGDDRFTLQGDLYRSHTDQLLRRLSPLPPFAGYDFRSREKSSGGNILGRWTHVFSESSEWTLQAYYDRTERGSDIRNTVDLDFQHRFRLGERQVVVWGAGFRHMQDRNSGSFDGELVPERRRVDLFSAFIQDEIVLVPKRLTLTLGTKFEHNDFTGVEVQPSGRLLWTPADRHTVWASVSRAVRTPSRGEDDLILRREPVYPAGAFFPGSPAVVTSLTGNREFESEELLAYELGYRVQPHERFSVDVAVFYNQYDGLRSFAPADPLVDFQSSIPTVRAYAINGLEGETYGGEISGTWHTTDWWRLRAHYSLLFTQIHQASPAPDLSTEAALEGTSPQQQFLLRSSLDLSRSIELDSTLRYVDSLPALALQSYLVVDVRLGWRASENVELSVVGQNLFRARHEEFKSSFVPVATSEVETGIYGKVTIRF